MDEKISDQIWTEKYRPKSLDEMIGQSHITKRLDAFVKSKNLPHCLFSGPAGVGKTTAALCIAKQLFGKTWKSNFLELNASDERGIDVIRNKVKDFARTIPMGENRFKIIYLDEADSLTSDAQQALRRMMESYSNTCRFILACNWSSKIIPPIQSRTAIFRFLPIPKSEIKEYLKRIAKNEKIAVEEDALNAIIYLSEGDMRKAINILQMAAISDKKITKDVVYSVTSTADPNAVKTMLESAIDGKFIEAREKLREIMIEQGLSGEDIIKEIHRQVFDLSISDEKKVELIEKIGEYEFRLTEGSNALIQLEALLAQFSLIGK